MEGTTLARLCGSLCLLLIGCATAQQRREAAAWAIICERAPHAAGHSYDGLEQRAMNVVHGWSLSVEAVDARCGIAECQWQEPRRE